MTPGEPRCGKCGLPIHPGESGVRHFGFFTAHSEGRCIELLKFDRDAAITAAVKAEREVCAKVADEAARHYDAGRIAAIEAHDPLLAAHRLTQSETASYIAAAIRAGGEP